MSNSFHMEHKTTWKIKQKKFRWFLWIFIFLLLPIPLFRSSIFWPMEHRLIFRLACNMEKVGLTKGKNVKLNRKNYSFVETEKNDKNSWNLNYSVNGLRLKFGFWMGVLTWTLFIEWNEKKNSNILFELSIFCLIILIYPLTCLLWNA